jgi:FtsZ-binding cell division protein ZapB
MAADVENLILRKLNRIEALAQAIPVLQQDIRMLRDAVNDFARENVTAGEIESVHTDLNRLQEKTLDLDTRLRALEG